MVVPAISSQALSVAKRRQPRNNKRVVSAAATAPASHHQHHPASHQDGADRWMHFLAAYSFYSDGEIARLDAVSFTRGNRDNQRGQSEDQQNDSDKEKRFHGPLIVAGPSLLSQNTFIH